MHAFFASARSPRTALLRTSLTLAAVLAGCQDAPPVAPNLETAAGQASPVSPGRIVYAASRSKALPDLYTLDLATGRTQRLTRDRTFDGDPEWSPDGQKIAFTSTRGDGQHVYVMSATGGALTRVSTTSVPNFQPAWSPDGSKILYATQGGGNADIGLAMADGSGTLAVLAANPAQDFDPAWCPTSFTGVKFAFISTRDNGSGDIYVYDDSQNPNVRRLTFNTTGGVREPAWSPDGTKIAYAQFQNGAFDVFVTNADGTGTPTNLTNSPGHDHMPAWSPDGSKIVFRSTRAGNPDLYTMNADGTGVTRLTRGGDDEVTPSWTQ